jgi:uncharacterized damage-inducible protein DinB
MALVNLADLLRFQRELSWEKEEWFVPLSAALEGVGAAEASWQPPGAGNTIWQMVNHINYWNEWILSYITGRPAPERIANEATFGAPGSAADVAGWQATLERTRRIADEIRTELAKLTDADLERPLGSRTLGEALASWMLHDAHHVGQILLIRKQQGSWPAKRG